jgi:MFS family permease
LRALRNRNYRLFFAGQGISLIGTWMQRIALNWLVYELTHSATMLGVIGFAGQIPTFLLGPLAGVLSDRWNLHRVIVITQVLATIQALILAALDLTHTTQVWHLLVLSIFLGVVNAFDMPARQTFVVQMLESPVDLPNAIALNSFLVNSARLLGPSIAGVLIAAVGEGVCFLLNGLSYVPVVVALLAMKLRPQKRRPDHKHVLHGLMEGFQYAFGFPPIRAILLLLATVSLMGMPYAVLMPIFADKILHGGPRTLGFLMAATGLGAIAGALFLARRSSVLGLGRLIAWSTAVFGAGLVAVSLSRILWLSLVLLAIAGFAMMQQMASSNTVLQTIVADEKRGRVMSFYTMSFMGMVPFGSLLAGGLAGWIGAPNTLLIGGAACVLAAAVFGAVLPGLRVLVRPIYMDKGIIPAVTNSAMPGPIPGPPPAAPPA